MTNEINLRGICTHKEFGALEGPVQVCLSCGATMDASTAGNEWVLPTKKVMELDNDFDFVNLSQDIEAFEERYPALKEQDWATYFVKTEDGMVTEIWGLTTVIPFNNLTATRIL